MGKLAAQSAAGGTDRTQPGSGANQASSFDPGDPFAGSNLPGFIRVDVERSGDLMGRPVDHPWRQPLVFHGAHADERMVEALVDQVYGPKDNPKAKPSSIRVRPADERARDLLRQIPSRTTPSTDHPGPSRRVDSRRVFELGKPSSNGRDAARDDLRAQLKQVEEELKRGGRVQLNISIPEKAPLVREELQKLMSHKEFQVDQQLRVSVKGNRSERKLLVRELGERFAFRSDLNKLSYKLKRWVGSLFAPAKEEPTTQPVPAKPATPKAKPPVDQAVVKEQRRERALKQYMSKLQLVELKLQQQIRSGKEDWKPWTLRLTDKSQLQMLAHEVTRLKLEYGDRLVVVCDGLKVNLSETTLKRHQPAGPASASEAAEGALRQRRHPGGGAAENYNWSGLFRRVASWRPGRSGR